MDDFERYRTRLNARIEQYLARVEAGKVNKTFVSFELLWSIFSAHEGGYSHDEIKSAYPVQAWREDTVTVPTALLREVVSGWERYRAPENKATLDKCLGLSGSKGTSPVKKLNRTIDTEKRRSNEVVIRLLEKELESGWIKQLAVFHEVAEEESLRTGKKVEPRTIESAFQKHGASTMKKFWQKHREVSDPSS